MSWWRRQRTAAIALMIAAMVAAGTIWLFEVVPSRDEPTVSTTVATTTVTVDGNTIDPPTVRVDEFAGPAGTTTVSVRVPARSDADASSCGSFTLTERATGRVWVTAGSEVDVSDDDAERSCVPDSASYTILAVFLLPDDVSGLFWFDMTFDDTVVRFELTG